MAKEAHWKTLQDVTQALLHAGIVVDPSLISKVVITVSAADICLIEVTQYPTLDQVGQLVSEITTKYDLVPRSKEVNDNAEVHRPQ